jgi:hypothetical protein
VFETNRRTKSPINTPTQEPFMSIAAAREPTCKETKEACKKMRRKRVLEKKGTGLIFHIEKLLWFMANQCFGPQSY